MGLWIFGKIFGATNAVSGAKTAPALVTPDGALMVGGKINSTSGASLLCTTAGLLRATTIVSSVTATGVLKVSLPTATSANITSIKGYTSASATSLAILDDWDESDRCKVNLSTATSANLTSIKGYTSASATSLAVLDDWDESDRCKVNLPTATSANLTSIKEYSSVSAASLAVIDDAIGTDGSAAPSKTIAVGGTDGTNLQTLSVDSSGVVYNQPATVPTFEDTVNGWASQKAASHAHGCSADVATVTVDGTAEGTADEIVPSTNVSTYRGFTLWVENLGATALNHVYVYASRDGTNWVCVDSIKNALETACDTLAATSNGICFSVTDNPGWRYVKCAATVAAGSTTATGAISYQM